MTFTRTVTRDMFKIASDDFHMILGYCIAEWGQVETELFRLCWTALRCRMHQAAIVYYRTPTMDSRLSLTSELIASHFPKPKSGDHPPKELRTWAKLESTIRSELKVRGRLAHHHTGARQELLELPPETGADVFAWEIFESYVSYAESLRGKHDERPSLKEADLIDHLRQVSEFSRQLDEYYHRVLKTRLGEPISARVRKS